MKIAYVSDAIYPYNKGGKEKRLYEISTRLAKRGHDVHIYCMKWWTENETDRYENGVHLHAISPLYPLYSGGIRSIKEGILFGIACLKLFTENWDIIDVDHMPFFPVISTKFVCILKRKKMFASWHEVWGLSYWKKYLGWKGYIAYLIEKISFYMPNKFLSISPKTSNRLIEENVPSSRVVTVPVGIDYEKIAKIPASKEYSDVIFAGRLLTHKNVDILLKSIKKIKQKNSAIKAIIIGNGPEKANLISLAENLDIKKNVIFKDFFKTENELFSFIKASKVFVLPSSREGLGLITLEANACGIQVITVNEEYNVSKDFVREFGIITSLDPDNLAHAILKTITNKIKPKISNKYSWDKIITKLEREYLS